MLSYSKGGRVDLYLKKEWDNHYVDKLVLRLFTSVKFTIISTTMYKKVMTLNGKCKG